MDSNFHTHFSAEPKAVPSNMTTVASSPKAAKTLRTGLNSRTLDGGPVQPDNSQSSMHNDGGNTAAEKKKK